MSRLSGVIVAVLLVLAPSGSSADHATPDGAPFEHPVDHAYRVAVPCGVACVHYLEGVEAACAPQPLTIPGSYSDWMFTLEPPADAGTEGIAFFIAGIAPAVDSDMLFCRREPDPEGERWLGPECPWVGGDATSCAAPPPTLPVGIRERGEIVVCLGISHPPPPAPGYNCVPRGTPVLVRVFNVADTFDVPGFGCWSRSGMKPGYAPCGRA